MHRNTAILIALLAVIAALIVGLKIGQRLNGTPAPLPISPSPVALVPSPSEINYTHPQCQVSLTYPAGYKLTEASDSAILLPQTTTDETSPERIVLLCGVDFPKPPLPPEKIETATVSGQRATVYHDASARDGTPVDVVVFTHPKTKLEVALFGFGEVFEKVLKSLTLN